VTAAAAARRNARARRGPLVDGAGLTTAETGRAVLRQRTDATVTGLDDPVLRGGPISDERYLLVSRR